MQSQPIVARGQLLVYFKEMKLILAHFRPARPDLRDEAGGHV